MIEDPLGRIDERWEWAICGRQPGFEVDGTWGREIREPLGNIIAA
jgi:hypothetical protein